ncbi:MAG TPA: hypothetical protein VGR21_01630, partial [Cryptosporangiaceae bacterium]|nr:hypothetical protein [Cryptosporangiaceae bacterium]
VLRLRLDEVSAKIRQGQVADEEDDLALPHWAGVLPLRTVTGAAESAPDLAAIPVPDYVTGWVRRDASSRASGTG